MLGVVEKGYWNATPATIETLRKTQESLHVEVAAEQDQIQSLANQRTAPDAVDLADPAPSQPTPPSTSSSTASPSGALPRAFAKQASGSTVAPRDAATPTARLVQGYTLNPKAAPAQRRNMAGATVQAMTGPGLLVGSLVGLGLVALGWWKEARSERVGRTALASLHSLPTPTQGL